MVELKVNEFCVSVNHDPSERTINICSVFRELLLPRIYHSNNFQCSFYLKYTENWFVEDQSANSTLTFREIKFTNLIARLTFKINHFVMLIT